MTEGTDAAASPASRAFASARIYARSLDDVAPLATWVRDQGYEVSTRAKEIETVKALDRVLAFIFLVLASIGVGGYLFSLAASLWANVDRKRREIALLRLVGLGTGPVIGFPVAQAVLVAVAGIALSIVLYLIVAAAFNATFIDQLGRDEFVCRLSFRDGAIAAVLTVLFAVAAAMVGGYRAAKIDPAEGLRASSSLSAAFAGPCWPSPWRSPVLRPPRQRRPPRRRLIRTTRSRRRATWCCRCRAAGR